MCAVGFASSFLERQYQQMEKQSANKCMSVQGLPENGWKEISMLEFVCSKPRQNCNRGIDMTDISIQIWILLINSALVVILASAAIYDGWKDRQAVKSREIQNPAISEAALMRVAKRHIRNGFLTFMMGNIAGSLATLYVWGAYREHIEALELFRDWLPWALNLILFLNLAMLIMDRYDRWLVLHPEREGFLKQWKKFLQKRL